MKRTLLCAFAFAMLLSGSLLADDVPALTVEAPTCGEVAWLTPAEPIDPFALSPLANAVETQGCCQGLQNQCENVICRDRGGVFEFTCNPTTCMASCLCNEFP